MISSNKFKLSICGFGELPNVGEIIFRVELYVVEL